MNYGELYNAIQTYTENQFPDVYLANGATVSAITQIDTFIQQAEQRIYNTVQFPSLRKNVTGSVSPSTPYLSAPSDFLAAYSLAVIDGTGAYEYLLNKDVNYIRQAYPNPSDTGLPKYYALFGPTVSGTTISNELSFILGPKPDAVYSAELHYYYYPASIVKSGVVSGRLTPSTGTYNYVVGTYEGVPAIGGSGEGLTLDITITNATGTPAIAAVTSNNGGQNYLVGDVVQVDLSTLTGGVDSGYVNITVATVAQDTENTTWLGDNFDSVLLYGSLVEAYTFMKGESDMVALYEAKYKEALGLAKRLGDGMERGDAYRDGQYKQKVI